MSDAKHTPGPWRAEPLEADGVTPVYIVAGPFRLDPLPNGISIEVANVNRQLGMTEANAALIAAAPDLLAALQNLLLVSLPHDVSGQRFIDQARAAIAKAKGLP